MLKYYKWLCAGAIGHGTDKERVILDLHACIHACINACIHILCKSCGPNKIYCISATIPIGSFQYIHISHTCTHTHIYTCWLGNQENLIRIVAKMQCISTFKNCHIVILVKANFLKLKEKPASSSGILVLPDARGNRSLCSLDFFIRGAL